MSSDVMVLGCRMDEDGLDLQHLLALLKAQGIDQLFVEGGGVTVTGFVSGLMDRLHLAVAPVFIGEGRRGITDALGRRWPIARGRVCGWSSWVVTGCSTATSERVVVDQAFW